MDRILINYLHLLGSIIWIGGAIYMHLVLQPSLKSIDPRESGKLQGIIAKRFSIVAWSSIIVLIITGFLKTPSSLLLDTTSNFGVILLIKHVFILLAIIVGLTIALYVVPNLQKYAPKSGESPIQEFFRFQKRLKTLAATNLIFALIILGMASMLW
ncbi:MAG: CopD family protein [Melioribacteraceae bacterium]|nr:CopD family protein [Melioribacteraceae bacterium]